MSVVSVNCNNCGSPLEVGAATRFVTCGHCGSRLEVKRTGSSAYTELLGEIAQHTGTIAGHVADLAREKEVERIDREWEQEKAKYPGDGTTGGPVVRVIVGLCMGAFGVFWVMTAAGGGAPAPFVCFGVAWTLIALSATVGGGLKALSGGGQYQAAEARYQQRRAAALNRQPPPG